MPPEVIAGIPTLCQICDEHARYRWTDTHAIAACIRCGACYQLWHYEEVDGKQTRIVNDPPLIAYREGWVPLLRRYWRETHRNVTPGDYNMPGSSYEVATYEDFETHRTWMEAHKAEWPPD
jgi:hypothetical protein